MEYPDTQPDFEDPFWDMVGSPSPKRAKAREPLWFCSTLNYMFVGWSFGLQFDSLRSIIMATGHCYFSSFNLMRLFKTGSRMGQVHVRFLDLS